MARNTRATQIEKEVLMALDVLREGKTILYPTDTIWGIGCDATSSQAVERVQQIKERKDRRSMLVLVENPDWLNEYVREIPDIAYQLMEASVHPLTIIYPGAQNLPENLLGEDGSIGIRLTGDPFCRRLLSRLGHPVVSTSANISSQPAPSSFRDISPAIKSQVDHVVRWRQEETTSGRASSIISLKPDGEIKIIRA